MGKIDLFVDQDKKDLKDNIQAAVTDLDLIIQNADTMTLAQARQAIGKLALYQKKIIKYLATMIS
jgi:hypothetical protein